MEFQDVTFYYEEDYPVLQHFDLRVEPGETVALIGPTGCGKSTILSLMRRYDAVELRKHFGIVLQEPLLFSCSIAENIRYSRPLATDEEIEEAARAAEIHDFIATLPQKYNTVLGTEGVDFSLGQRQRITIARAIVADPSILIMDEATSSLDSESERSIQRAMYRILKNRTAFIVAHRLSTIRHANRIVLLDKGRIVEMGRHDQLMAIPNGRYRSLYLKHRGSGVIEE